MDVKMIEIAQPITAAITLDVITLATNRSIMYRIHNMLT